MTEPTIEELTLREISARRVLEYAAREGDAKLMRLAYEAWDDAESAVTVRRATDALMATRFPPIVAPPVKPLVVSMPSALANGTALDAKPEGT